MKDAVDIEIPVFQEQAFEYISPQAAFKTEEKAVSQKVIGVINKDTDRAVDQGEMDKMVVEQLNIMNLINKYKYGGIATTEPSKTVTQTTEAYNGDRSKLQTLLSKGILQNNAEPVQSIAETREAARVIAANAVLRRKMIKIDMVKRLCNYLDKVDENSS